MNKVIFRNKPTKAEAKKPSLWLKISLYIFGALILLFLITIPWRNYIAKKNIADGDRLLTERKYTEAYVHFQKAKILSLSDKNAEDRAQLTVSASKDITKLKDFFKEQNQSDLLKVIDDASSKVCNLDTDRLMIERGLSQIAVINLNFCTTEGPKDYSSWLLLGVANLQVSEDSSIFKDDKPTYRKNAILAFEGAYKADPVNKTAIEYIISVHKSENNQKEVDRWQKLLDNLVEIEK
jgi:hypothetical protein